MTDQELVTMAKMVIEKSGALWRQFDWEIRLEAEILEALRIANTQAVEFPSNEEIAKASQFRIVNPEIAPDFAKVMMAMKRTEWLGCTDWLKSNIKISLRVNGFYGGAQPKPFDKTQTWRKLK